MMRFIIWQLFFLNLVIKLSENANDSASDFLVSYKGKQRDERQTQEKAINLELTNSTQINFTRFSIMSNALFIELSVEQQEVVAGGFSIPTLTENNFAKYKLNSKSVFFGTTAVAGPGGASSTKVFKASEDKIRSSAGDILTYQW